MVLNDSIKSEERIDLLRNKKEMTILEHVDELKKAHDEFIYLLKKMNDPNSEYNDPTKWWNR